MPSLRFVIGVLERRVPLALAAEWDNVGLLVEPFAPRSVRRVLLTIDLTEPVVEEAVGGRFDLVVAYHPPIFRPLDRLTRARPGSRAILRLLAARIAVWSPHTALDAVPGGINDWLADGVGAGEREPIEPAAAPPGADRGDGLALGAGQGRWVRLRRPVSLATLSRRIKRHLDLPRLRVATAERHRSAGGERSPIGTIALCPGAGGSVLASTAADLWLTGEMRHHDVLEGLARGTSVILTEHSNCERGGLARFARQVESLLGDAVEVRTSTVDADPLALA